MDSIERVVIDDERTHRDGGIHLRTSAAAITWLNDHPDQLIGELWLDHDLGGDDTIRPVVELLERRCFDGTPQPITVIWVHTANPVGADRITTSRLLTNTYQVRRATLDQFQSQPS